MNILGQVFSLKCLRFVVGYPFGGFMYEFVGKTPPFLVIATVATTEGGKRT